MNKLSRRTVCLQSCTDPAIREIASLKLIRGTIDNYVEQEVW